MMKTTSRILALVAGLALFACGGPSADDHADHDHDHDHDHAEAPTNRIDLGAQTERNLGITWAEARSGRLEVVLSVPGEITPRPGHEWTIAAPLGGIVTEIAELWSEVERGQFVATLAGPDLAQAQEDLDAARGRADAARLELARVRAGVEPLRDLATALAEALRATEAARPALETAVGAAEALARASRSRLEDVTRLRATDAVSEATLLAARREALEADEAALHAANALRDVRVEIARKGHELSEARIDIDEREGRLAALEARLAAAESAFATRLGALAAASGTTAEELGALVDGRPLWSRMRELPLRAPAGGVVAERRISRGSHCDRDEVLLVILDPETLGFRALLPEADAARLPTDLALRVAVPGVAEPVDAEDVRVRPVADSRSRSLVLEARLPNPDHRLRPGLSARGLVRLDRSETEEILVPAACVVRDGLEFLVFRRDPADADRVIRTPVTMGRRSGDLVEIIAGVGEGDELVENGVNQLRDTGLGKASVAGHFHADGTFHAGDH
ncbi:MAG: efflux RND transporter periplasmic adaptor subunit [Planctomycetota bacterium]